MKPYLDSEDPYYYSISHEPKAEPKAKAKKDYGNYAALIFSFTVIAIVTAVTIYTAWNIAFGQPVEFKTYTNKDLGFTIQHPSKWKVDEEDTEVSFTIRENEKEDVEVNEIFSMPASLFDSFFLVKLKNLNPILILAQ
jgi:hypothetical protein